MPRRIPAYAAVLALVASGGVAGLAHGATKSKPYTAMDEQYLKSSVEGDHFETNGGKLAASKDASSQVKALGARLLKDHTKSVKEADAAAKKLGIKVSKTPSPSEQWELSVVATFSGSAFDKQYSGLEYKDHEQDIQETKDEISQGTNPTIVKLAKSELPVLEQHLKLSHSALKASGGS